MRKKNAAECFFLFMLDDPVINNIYIYGSWNGSRIGLWTYMLDAGP